MDKQPIESTRSGPHHRGAEGPFRRDVGNLERPRTSGVSLNEHDEIVLTVTLPSGRRHATRLGAAEARRLAADLLAFAGAVDGSSGE